VQNASSVPAGTFRANHPQAGAMATASMPKGKLVYCDQEDFGGECSWRNISRLELIWQSALLWSLCLSDVDFEMFLREHSPTPPASANAREIIKFPFLWNNLSGKRIFPPQLHLGHAFARPGGRMRRPYIFVLYEKCSCRNIFSSRFGEG